MFMKEFGIRSTLAYSQEKNNMSKNTVEHNYNTSKKDRNKVNDHNSFLIWFTGLSGSGKSTILK